MFHGIGPTEIVVILVVLFILLGHRLPQLMRYLGRGAVAFRDGWINDVRFRQQPQTPRSISVAEWLLILILMVLLVALFLPRWMRAS